MIILLVTLVISYAWLRRLRSKGHKPTYIPGGFLTRKWEAWKPRSKYSQITRSRAESLNQNTAYNGAEVEERAATQAVAAGVDRNTSVRSVMTLPAYSQSPQPSEQVIGREGERGGMDTVVEFPETNDEEEVRREDQMASLYQIRLARRREIAEREERRRERREARERGDWNRLEELRRDSRQRANQSNESINGGLTASAATLIAEHQSRGRDRRVSSVTYAELGHVRHDGTRIRANSNDSERGGLLEGAAAMGEDETRPRGSSESRSLAEPRPQFRNRSASSALSISTTASDIDRPLPHTPQSSDRPRTASSHNTAGSGSNGTTDSSPTANRFTPVESSGSEDIGESRIPTIDTVSPISPDRPHPPIYETLEWGDAPAYTEREAAIRRAESQRQGMVSPVTEVNTRNSVVSPISPEGSSRAPQLPALNLPSIAVEGPSGPNTPMSPNFQQGEQR